VKYEQVETFDEAVEVAEKKEMNMEEVPWKQTILKLNG
jgi:hypothetical protein